MFKDSVVSIISMLPSQFNANRNIQGVNNSLEGTNAHFIRINPVNFTPPYACMRIALYGCDEGWWYFRDANFACFLRIVIYQIDNNFPSSVLLSTIEMTSKCSKLKLNHSPVWLVVHCKIIFISIALPPILLTLVSSFLTIFFPFLPFVWKTDISSWTFMWLNDNGDINSNNKNNLQ